MVIQLKVVDRGRLLPANLMERLRQRTRKLAQFFGGVEECRLSVDGPGHYPLPERVRVRLYLSVSGAEVAVSRRCGEVLSIALHYAFDAAERRLQAHARLGRTGGSQGGRGPKRRAGKFIGRQ